MHCIVALNVAGWRLIHNCKTRNVTQLGFRVKLRSRNGTKTCGCARKKKRGSLGITSGLSKKMKAKKKEREKDHTEGKKHTFLR